MQKVAHTAYEMISAMTPELMPGSFVFVSSGDTDLIASLRPHSISVFEEAEGLSMLVPTEVAQRQILNVDHPMRCITLNVYSSLEGIGLTAAVASALAENSIPCNMIAAFHHDHVFVPSEKCERAMEVLMSLQEQAVEHP